MDGSYSNTENISSNNSVRNSANLVAIHLTSKNKIGAKTSSNSEKQKNN